jgi:hypothetical protein
MKRERSAVPANAVLALLLVAGGPPAARAATQRQPAADGPPPSATPPAVAEKVVDDAAGATGRGFSLQLEDQASWSRSFGLLEGPAYTPSAGGSLSLGRLWWPGIGRRALDLPPRWTIGAALGYEYGPDGRRRIIVFGPPKSWSDLDFWEKSGLVLEYSAAAASAIHFANKLIRKLR